VPHQKTTRSKNKLASARASLITLGALTLFAFLSAAPVLAASHIRAGLEQNPPLSFIDEQGKPTGLLVELLDYIAAREGWIVEYVPDTFDRCLEKLAKGQLDLMVTIAYSDDRDRLFDFNQENVIANWGQLYAAPNSDIESYFDLEGKRVAVMRRDIHYQAFRSMMEKFGLAVDYLEVDNFAQVFQAVSDRRADAGIVGRFYALQNEDQYDVGMTPIVFNPIEVRYAVPEGTHQALIATLDRNLAAIKADRGSVYYQALDRWLGVLSKRGIPHWVPVALASGVGLVLVLLGFNTILRRRVRNRTRHLRQEIRERERAETALRGSEIKYRELVENVNSVILRLDPDCNVTFFNEFAETFFGYQRGEIIGRNILETLVPKTGLEGQDLQRAMREVCKDPSAYVTLENENVRKNGERVWMSWTNRPLLDTDGNVNGVLAVGQDITERKRYEAELHYQAHYDTLTGLPNRVLLLDRMRQAIALGKRQQTAVSVILLDLDNFKIVNDTLGHAQGDRLLVAVAERLTSAVRETDTVARMGGDEFVVLCPALDGGPAAGRFAVKLLSLFAKPFQLDAEEVFVTASLGVVICPDNGDQIDSLITHADVAMYHAKRMGKNNFQFFTGAMNRRVHVRMTRETKLRRALEREEFAVHYQPQVSIATGAITGVEALLRWFPGTGESLSPDEFVPILEETGMILPVGEWLLATSCRDAQAWSAAGAPALQLSVNFSARQFAQSDVLQRIERILGETGFDPKLLCLELTESVLMQDNAAKYPRLTALRKSGVHIAIDDFGTGYSCLSYLKQLPITQLKIDRSFVRGLPDDQNDVAIVNTIIAVAHSLGLHVIAEGVETDQQFQFLRDHNGQDAQGFYFCRPISSCELLAHLCAKSATPCIENHQGQPAQR